jgi:hypothetical protein
VTVLRPAFRSAAASVMNHLLYCGATALPLTVSAADGGLVEVDGQRLRGVVQVERQGGGAGEGFLAGQREFERVVDVADARRAGGGVGLRQVGVLGARARWARLGRCRRPARSRR